MPATSLARATILALVIMVTGVGIWEAAMRAGGLTTNDLGDSVDHWAVERHKIDAGDTAIAIVGSSRILFDSDLDIWQAVTGERPIQLALAGTSPRLFIEDLADDEDFKGLVVVGVAPGLYFSQRGGLFEAALDRYRAGSPSQRTGHFLQMQLEPIFAFLDPDSSLFMMIERSWILPEREGVSGPYFDVWKISWNGKDRQTSVWERLSRDAYLRQHAYEVWMQDGPPFDWDQDDIDATIEETKGYIEKIRAKGGEIVFVRAPSSHGLREREREELPRDLLWDPLIAKTGAIGIHFEDYPELSEGMVVIEWSHLEKPSAQRFSRALATILQKKLAQRGYIIGGTE